MQKTYTRKITSGQEKSDIVSQLVQAGWEDLSPKNEFVERYFKTSGGVITIYKSGKLVSQISDENSSTVKSILPLLLPQVEMFNEQTQEGQILNLLADKPHIGCDEAGKGEYFGPLVAAACYLNSEKISKFRELGVRDSKLLSRSKAESLARALEKECVFAFRESMCEKGNMSEILARLHSEAIDELLMKLSLKSGREKSASSPIHVEGLADTVVGVLIDKFSIKNVPVSKQKIPIYLVEKGERDIVVAAASIIARAKYLQRVRELEVQYNVAFPHGYGEATKDFARDFIKNFGMLEFKKIAKVSFKTTNEL